MKPLLVATACMGLAFSAASQAGAWTLVKGGAWKPDSATSDDIRRTLEPFVSETARELGGTMPVWSSYLLQYQGQMLDGERVVVIQGVCKDIPVRRRRDLRTEFRGVLDGGPCVFRVLYHPDVKRYSNLLFNGVA